MTERFQPSTGPVWHRVCDSPELTGSQCREFVIADTPGFAFRHQGQVYAFINRCPHLGIELNWLPERFFDREQTFIQCSTHGALFKPSDGECIAGPCQGDALTQLDLRERDGQIEIRLPE